MSLTHCANGHEYSDANTLTNSLGYKVCRVCNRASHARYRNSDKGLQKRFEIDLKRHSLTVEEFNKKAELQNNVCAICKLPGDSKRLSRLSVDHDHETDVTRDLLCSNCNSMLGLAQDSSRILELGAAYLRKHGK